MKKQDLMKTLPISRRAFNKLSMSGILMTAAPLHYAYSQTSQKGVAKRFISFVVPGGVWHPTYTSGDAGGINFGKGVKALEPYKNQIVAFEGLNNVAGTNKQHHDRGMCSIMTGFQAPSGSKENAQTLSKVRSVDQILSDKIGKNTFFKSVEAGMFYFSRVFTQSRMVYSAPGTPRNPIATASGLFDKLYKGRDFNGGGGNEPDPLASRRKSALDAVMQQIALMEKELVGDDKERMQQHLNSVQEIEQRIQTGSGPTSAGAACAPPSSRPGSMNPHAETDLIADMSAQALICGLTNVITIQVDREGCTLNYEFLKEWTDNYGPRGARHHSVTHDDSFKSQGTKDAFSAVDTFWSNKVARILKLLDSVPEDGGTMLDNTVMMFGSPLSRPNNHSHNDLRWMLIGGQGLGRWKTNRFVDAKGEKAHNLYISMMQACGLEVDTVGNNQAGDRALSVL